MASFEPIVVLYGSSKSISTIHLRLPVSFVFTIDEASLEDLITADSQLSDTCLQRYFVILLESVSDDVLEHLHTNHRVQVIYSRDVLTCSSGHLKLHRIINKQLQQFTLDLTGDIVPPGGFLTVHRPKFSEGHSIKSQSFLVVLDVKKCQGFLGFSRVFQTTFRRFGDFYAGI